MRNPNGKTHTKKRVQYDVFNKLLIRETRDSPPETCKPFIPIYSTHEMWSIVDLVNISSRLSQVLSLQMCSYAHMTYETEPS